MPKKKVVKLSEGVEHYDDGYSSDESLNDTLDFDAIHSFGGSQKLLQTLKQTYEQNVALDPAENESSVPVMTVVKGYSGTGKSRFVEEFLAGFQIPEFDDVNNNQQLTNQAENKCSSQSSCAYCISGEYEVHDSIPFSGIVKALSKFFRSIVSNAKSSTVNYLKSVLEVGIGDELAWLATMVPALSELSPPDINDFGSNKAKDSMRYSYSTRATYLLRTLLKVLIDTGPIILVLDNFNYADWSSLNFIESLLSDTALGKLMIIIAYRNDNVDDNSRIERVLKSPEQHKVRQIPEVELTNLTKIQTEEYIAAVLHLGTEDTHELADVIFTKTSGNIFFIRRTLEELEKKEHLYFSRISFQWEWNLDEVKNNLPDSVVDNVLSTVKEMEAEKLQSLTIAALINYSVNVQTLKCIIRAMELQHEDKWITDTLEEAEHKGVLITNVDPYDENTFVFSHNRIYQEFYNLSLLTEEEDISDIKLKVGKSLGELGLSKHGQNWMLFVATEHIRLSDGNLDPLFIAELNLIAGEKALEMASPLLSQKCLQIGVDAINTVDSHWSHHYDLTLRLYTSLIHSEEELGNFDNALMLSCLVRSNAKCFLDTTSTYKDMSSLFFRQNKAKEAFNTTKTALQLMGLYPKASFKFDTAKCMLKVQRYFKKHSDDEFLQLPHCSDKSKEFAIRSFREASVYALDGNNPTESALMILRGMKLTIKHGLFSKGTSQIIELYGVLQLKMGNIKEGFRCAQLSRKVLNLLPHKHGESTYAATHGWFFSPWIENQIPIQVMSNFYIGQKHGFESGDAQRGVWNSLFSSYSMYGLGFPLNDVKKSIDETLVFSTIYKCHNVSMFINELQSKILTLTGKQQFNPTTLNDIEGVDMANHFSLRTIYSNRVPVGVYFNEYAAVEGMLDKYKLSLDDPEISFHFLTTYCTFAFLAATGVIHQTNSKEKKKREKRRAKRILDKVRRCKLLQPDQFLYIKSLLEAEWQCLRKNITERDILTSFDAAIDAAIENENIQFLALGCELAGEHLLRIEKKKLAASYLSCARDCYNNWEASGKVTQLEKKRGHLIKNEGQSGTRLPILERVSKFLLDYRRKFNYNTLISTIKRRVGTATFRSSSFISDLSHRQVEEFTATASLKKQLSRISV